VPEPPDRELRRSKAEYRLAGQILELLPRAVHVRPKGASVQAVNKVVVVGVAPDLVTASRDVADELRIRLGDHADDEESRAHAGFVEQVEDPVRISDDVLGRRCRVAGDSAA
jgi:hypothetical protein